MHAKLVEDLLDLTLVGSPRHEEFTRPVHSFGIALHGHFRGSTHAQRYCGAELFSPEPTPTVVRFSNSAGQRNPEVEPQIRGMAAKFFGHASLHYLDTFLGGEDCYQHRPFDQESEAGIEEVDLILTGLSNFFAKTPEPLAGLFEALAPERVKPPSRWQRLLADLRLNPLPKPVVPVAESTDRRVLDWAKKHRQSHAAVVALGLNATQPPPASFGRLSYHAIHAFNIIGEHGARNIARFSFEPVQGVRDATPDEGKSYSDLDPQYLTEELRTRNLSADPLRFTLRMTLADPWDDPTDPTVVWPSSRRQVIMGTLDLRARYEQWIEPDGWTNLGEGLSFNPGRLPLDHIFPTDDKLLKARIAVYRLSQLRRVARCPFGTGEVTEEMAELLELEEWRGPWPMFG